MTLDRAQLLADRTLTGAAWCEQHTRLFDEWLAALFDVDPRTVSSWGNAGKLTVIRTLGGHRRYLETEVLALRNEHPRVPTQRQPD